MQRIAIYDLDKTILAKPTFTAFLVFAACRSGRRLYWRAPLWIAALIGYKLKLYGRKPMKQFGLRLFVGGVIATDRAERLAREFTGMVVPDDVQPGAVAAIAADRAEQRRLVIATAAQELYVCEIARVLQFDEVIATRQQRLADGGFSHRIDGENCYGDEKLRRVQKWLAKAGIDRSQCHIRFYSDHPSDAALLDWADEGILVGNIGVTGPVARDKGWKSADFAKAAAGLA